MVGDGGEELRTGREAGRRHDVEGPDRLAVDDQPEGLGRGGGLVAPVADTIKGVKDGHVVRTLHRAQLRRALTPQCFRLDLLKQAYDQLEEVPALELSRIFATS